MPKQDGQMEADVYDKLVLASGSPRRKELLGMLNLPFEVIPSQFDERSIPASPTGEYVEKLAYHKAADIAKHCENKLVLGADTVVILDDQVLGKPSDEAAAFQMLNRLQDNQHIVLTGMALIHTDVWKLANAQRQAEDTLEGVTLKHTVNKVYFKPMSEDEIWAYIKTGEPMDKAGAYGVQGMGSFFIERIEGDFYSVMGLPLHLLYQLLKQINLHGSILGSHS